MWRNEMIRIVLILFILVSNVVSDDCVKFTFENNFHKWLTHKWDAQCIALPLWIEGKYSNINLISKHDHSNKFISPESSTELSCVSSFIFTMRLNGKLEVNIYMEKDEAARNNVVVIAKNAEDANDIYGNAWMSVVVSNFENGWHTLTIPLERPGSYEGYVSIVF